MKKIKFLIASMLGAIALVFACVIGTRVNAAVSFGGTHDYEWSVQDLFASAGGTTTATNLSDSEGIFAVDGGGFAVWETIGPTLSTSVANGTNYTFDWIAVTGGSGRVMTLSVPEGVDKVEMTMFWVNSKKDNSGLGGSNRSIGLSGSYDDLTVNNVVPSDITKVSLPKSTATVYKVSLSYANTVSLTLNTDIAFLGAYADEVTVSADDKCTVSFNLNGGTINNSSTYADQSLEKGSSYSLPVATKEDYYLAGWKDSISNEIHTGNYIIPNASEVTLTAQWNSKINMDLEMSFDKDGITSSSSNGFATFVGDSTNKNSSWYNSFNGNSYIANTNYAAKLNKVGFVTFATPKDGTLYLVFSVSDYQTENQYKVVFDSTEYAIPENGIIVIANVCIGQHTLTRTNGESHLFYAGYKYDSNEEKLANSVSLTFDAQFNDDSTKEKLRFVLTIDGIQVKDYEKITNIKYSFVMIDKDNQRKSIRTKETTQLYSSVSALDSEKWGADESKLYSVFTLKNVNKQTKAGTYDYSGYKLACLGIVVSFNDGSSRRIIKDAISLSW